MPDALRLAMGTFTAIRVPAPGRLDARVAGGAMLLAPLTALPAAAVWLALLGAAAMGWLPELVAAGLAVAAAALLSRALHLDGLADLADGLSAGHDPERSLAVMRRSDVGPSGTAAVVLTLVVEVGALASLASSRSGLALAVTALLSSRLSPAVACRRGVPPARPDGLGRLVAGTVAPVTGLAAASALSALALGITAVVELPWYAVLLVVVTAPVSGWIVTDRAVRRLGGVTGDAIGAAVELSLAAALVVASVLDLATG